MFHETGDRNNFQARFVIRHAYKGPARCAAGREYQQQILPQRRARQMSMLAELTGWSVDEIRSHTGVMATPATGPTPWWRWLWAR